MGLLDPLQLGSMTSSNRVMFGPIVTNLGDDERRFTPRHTAFYQRRAHGGAGIIVTEGASVHSSDWPYERAPLASACGPGWQSISAACHAVAPTSLVIASLDHAGGQGSSAYSQAPLWAPSRVPEVNSREVPKWMEDDDIAAVIAGFGDAAALATTHGACDGVEINAGQHSLVRQFLSGLTNHRGDQWGTDRLAFARAVLSAARSAMPAGRLLGLRLSCDELAPWAGITPEIAAGVVAELAPLVDYLVVVRGSIYTIEKTRPDFHEPAGFNIDLTRSMRAAVGSTPVFLQGSVVSWDQAAWAIGDGVCDGVEMTRAMLADPSLVAKAAAGSPSAIRPCIRCNQTCQVRDGRNPIITCVVEPSTGFESTDPDWYSPTSHPRNVLVIGAGVAGLETARVAALRGHQVRVVERSAAVGGVAAFAGPGGPYVEWLHSQVSAAGVSVSTNVDNVSAAAGEIVVQCTGGQPGLQSFVAEPGAVVFDISDVRSGVAPLPESGDIVLFDPIGGPIAVALAEELGARAVLVTQDQIAGNELSRTGDLAPANARLQQRGVRIERRSLLRVVRAGEVELEDRFTGDRRVITAVAVVNCGFREPTSPLPFAHHAAGDCVAPRTILEATLEARRIALSI